MARRTANFACAILLGIIGSTLLTLLAPVASVAAEDCLTEPTGDKTDGQHWYYRFDRNSNRRCWYLKDRTGNAKDTTREIAPRQPLSQPASAWDFGQSTPPKFAPRRGDDTAKAQLGTATTSVVRTRPAAASFDDNLRRDMPPAPWQPPQTQLLDSADIDASASPATADDPATEVNPAAAPMPADATGAAKPVKPTAPIHKLLMVVIGALSLSGLLASAQDRLSKAGRARRRNRNWQRALVRARRNRDKPRNKKAVHAGSRPGRAIKPPAARVTATAVRVSPPPAIAAAVELPPAIVPSPAKIPDPAIEPADPIAARAKKTSTAKPPAAAKPVPQPAVAPVTPQPIEPARAAERQPALEVADPAAELVDLLGAHAAKKAVQQPKQVSRPAASNSAPAPRPPAEPAPPRLPRIEDPEAELANLLESRFAPPAPPARQTADRSKIRPDLAPAVAPVAPAVSKVVDPITELADLLEAKESKRAARLASAAAPRQEKNTPVVPITPPVAQPVDPAELFGMLEAHPAKPAPPAPEPRAARAPRPIEQTRPVREPRPGGETRPVQAAQSPQMAQGIKTAQQSSKDPAPRRKKPSPAQGPGVTTDIAPAKTIIRAPAQVRPVERAAAPKSGKPAGKAPRRKNADLRPLPPALMETANHDGPTPPLDFIPRPQALRPKVQDIRQDESLDGVQDILARLARHG